MIRFTDVCKTYPGGQEALRQLSLEFASGEFVFVTGRSGAGKSTLLKLIALIERPTRGQILVQGQNLERIGPSKIPHYRRRIGYIFQDHRLLFDRTVFDNVALPLAIAGLANQETAKRVRAALDRVGLLGKERRRPLALSAGEQQRVGIARAVVHKPDILLADEPTGNLDAELAVEIMRLFERFNQIGVTVVIATHNHDLLRFGHRVLTLDGGELIGDERTGLAA
jgi:cell division transport system ATP-binding protein